MSQDEPTNPQATENQPHWTDKQLPPVKPPTTGLLMQLFFVPMVIVSIIVCVWLLFGWLAQSGNNPEQLASNLKQLNKGSWQDALSLSNLLRDPRETELRQNQELADSLAETLDSLLADKALATSPERHRLATWLCRALGQFEVDNGLDVLVRALKSSDFAIRRAAVEGISTLAGKLGSDITKSRSDLVEVLRDPAMERSEIPDREKELEYGEMRSAAAYALGVIGTDEAIAALTLMLGDAYPEARYNAATGLARNGDLRSVPRLREMLKLNNDEAIRYEEESGTLRAWKQNLVIVNGLRAILELYGLNDSEPIDEELIAAARQLEESGTLRSTDAWKLVLDKVLRLIKERSS